MNKIIPTLLLGVSMLASCGKHHYYYLNSPEAYGYDVHIIERGKRGINGISMFIGDIDTINEYSGNINAFFADTSRFRYPPNVQNYYTIECNAPQGSLLENLNIDSVRKIYYTLRNNNSDQNY